LTIISRRRDDPEIIAGDEDLGNVVIEFFEWRPLAFGLRIAFFQRPFNPFIFSGDGLFDRVRRFRITI